MRRLVYWILLVLVILLPWHAFLVTLLSDVFLGSDSNFLPTMSLTLAWWKEATLILIWVCFLFEWKRLWVFPLRHIYFFDLIFLGFLVIALSSWAFQSASFVQWLWGFRLDFSYFILFYLLRWFHFEWVEIRRVFISFVSSSLIALVFWFWLYSFSFDWVPSKINYNDQKYLDMSEQKKEFLDLYYDEIWELFAKDKEIYMFFDHHEQINFRNENFLNVMNFFGYSRNISSYNPEKPLAAFHFVEARWTARFAWTFAGPNQAGFFLIVFISLLLGYISSISFAEQSKSLVAKIFGPIFNVFKWIWRSKH